MDDSAHPRFRMPFGGVIGVLGAVLAVVSSVVVVLFPLPALRLPLWGFALVAVALVVFRHWWETVVLRRGGRVPALVFVGHVVVSFLLVAVHPLYGIYAFIGHLDAARVFRGPRLLVAAVAVSAVMAFSQIGGTIGGWASPAVYLALVVVNTVIAGTMNSLETRREVEVARRLETMEKLLAAERENAALQVRIADQAREAGVLDERARLSREIHDTVAQGLVGIVRQLEAIDPRGPEAEWRARVDTAAESARDSLAEARRAVAALASPRLDVDDLPTALDRLVTSWSAATGLDGRCVVDGDSRAGAHDATLLRITQEALANIRHGAATRAVVTLSYADDSVRLDIRDDGRGFDPQEVSGGHGLAGMRRRVQEAGGTVEIDAAPGQGCTVSAEVGLVTGGVAR